MLEHDGVTQQKVRRREAGNLVVREVPWHNAQQRAERLLLNNSLLRALGRQVLGREQLVSVLGVPAVDVSDDLNLALCPARELTHLTADVLG